MSATAPSWTWEPARAAEALEAVSRASGLAARASTALAAPSAREPVTCALDRGACALGIEVEPVEVLHGDAVSVLESSAPAVIAIEPNGNRDGSEGARLLALLGRHGSRLRVLAPDLRAVDVPLEEARAYLCGAVEGPVRRELADLVASVDVAPRRRGRALARLLADRLGHRTVATAYLLRTPPTGSFWRLLREGGLLRRLAQHTSAVFLVSALSLAAFALVGRGALAGRLDWGWLLGWALMLLTTVPLRALATFSGGMAALEFGARLKQRLLSGALALDPDEPRREGAGRLLSRVLESSEVEALSFSATLLVLTAAIEIGASAWIMLHGVGGAGALLALGGHAGVTLALAARAHQARRQATRLRLEMTHDLIERIAGHRTRLAQEAPERWHVEEDAALERYVYACRRVDRIEVAQQAVAQRGWMVVGLLPLLPALVRGGASAADVAIGIGGLLLASQGWQRLSAALQAASTAALAWTSARPLFDAAARTETTLPPAAPSASAPAAGSGDASADTGAPPAPSETLLEARELSFRHAGRAAPVLRDASFCLRSGDQVLIEGPSGSGKSTLGALVAGLRQPASGLLLLRGLDRPALGSAEWRRRIASAPQFHDNYILSGTLAFNLLMGRSWPPAAADLAEAESVCRALELGPLLERMPAGMQQMVGETGWQLSHGERSRVFLARALLQRSEVTVLDESFGALDPATMQRALAATRARARTLMLIAHP